MKREIPPHNPDLAKAEQRRSKRFPVVVPLEVVWRGPDGVSVKEEALAKQVNAQGGLLQMKAYPEVGTRVELTNFLSAEAAQARVLALRRSKEGAVLGVAVELVVPSEAFWGVNFQLKKTNAQLFKLEQALLSGGVDLRVLRDFRDAVDYVRTTAGAVQKWQELQLQGRGADQARSLLLGERIRHTAFLSEELAADLDSGEVNLGTKGIAELYRAVEKLYQRLGVVLEHRGTKYQLARKT